MIAINPRVARLQPRILKAPGAADNVDVRGLEEELRNTVRGEVRFGDGDRALYSTDSSNYRQIPIGVVVPLDREDVIATVAACRKFQAPITGRGGGTSLAGQCCNVAVIIDFTKYMNRILSIDPQRRLVTVEPGVVLDEVQHAVQKHGLIFGPDPATHSHCAIGGMLGNNSCGVHSVMAEFFGGGARTSDNVREMEVLLYDGTILRVGGTLPGELDQIIRQGGRKGLIYKQLRDLRDRYENQIRQRFPDIPRRVSGYNLDELLTENSFHVARALVGTESTCVLILEATLELLVDPPKRTLLVLGYPDIYSAGDAIREVRKHQPIGLEGIDDVLINAMKIKHIHPRDLEIMPPGKGWLIVEFGGKTTEEADDRAKHLMRVLGAQPNPPSMKLIDDPVEEKVIWEVRDSGLGASARVPNEPDTWEGWEDSAVHPHDIGRYLRDFRALLEKYGYLCTLYGHFGQGLVHTRIDFGLKTHDGVLRYRAFTKEAAELVRRYNGSLSGEHGDGQSRADLLSIMFGEQLVEAFRQFKSIWDPLGKLNPGKVVDPYERDENLRYGEHYEPAQWDTQFRYPEDKGSFSFALERCVGVGQCRRHEHGTMCPSYMVTREEKHSTRGRARRLWEMLQGDVIGKKGWRDDSVRDALDLCLACKGCKADCPVNVDMATYKAEFFSHYYAGRLRPVSAYAMGLIYWWSRIAAFVPDLVNFFTQTAPFSQLLKLLGGIAPERSIPRFANETFKEWFANRPSSKKTGPGVILWADTFNNHFHPETAKAAVEVLEAAGFRVMVPPQSLCCGRPLYDFGMLKTAKSLLKQILLTLREEIEVGTYIVGLEPSCVAVFRDELVNLFPNDENARRLSRQTMMLAEFLETHAPNFQPQSLGRTALLHGHCHDKSIMKMKGEEALLKKAGVEVQMLDSGCCGMAGSFGFEHDHYEVSVQCGERVLLPEVRKAPKEAFIVSDGFSCREQIEQLSPRKSLHFAQVMRMAIPGRAPEPQIAYPENNVPTDESIPTPPRKIVLEIGISMLLLAGGLFVANSLLKNALRIKQWEKNWDELTGS